MKALKRFRKALNKKEPDPKPQLPTTKPKETKQTKTSNPQTATSACSAVKSTREPLASDEQLTKWMRQAFKLSTLAVQAGNHPFGAVLILDGKVAVEAQNAVVTEHDATRHAELVFIAETVPLNCIIVSKKIINIEQCRCLYRSAANVFQGMNSAEPSW